MFPCSRFLLSTALAAGLVLTSSTASAGWREDIGTFRIGVVKIRSGNEMPGSAALKKRVSDVLGMPVEIFLARDILTLAKAQAQGHVNYGIYTGLGYAVAQKLCDCLVPLAAPIDRNGATGISLVLLMRDPGNGMEPLVPVRVAMPPVTSLPAEFLEDTSDPGLQKLVSDRLVRTGSAEQAEIMFTSGEAQALIGWVPVSRQGEDLAGGTILRVTSRPEFDDALRIMWRSPAMRYGPHAVNRDLSGEAVQLLKAFLIELNESDPVLYETLVRLHSGGFEPVTDADYEGVRKLLEIISGEESQSGN